MLDGNCARTLISHGPKDHAREIHAKYFVLCAGVYGSPAILLRSGIGPADYLTQLRIPVRIALPGVGANLHDHPGVGLEYEPTTRALRAAKEDLKVGDSTRPRLYSRPRLISISSPTKQWRRMQESSRLVF